MLVPVTCFLLAYRYAGLVTLKDRISPTEPSNHHQMSLYSSEMATQDVSLPLLMRKMASRAFSSELALMGMLHRLFSDEPSAPIMTTESSTHKKALS